VTARDVLEQVNRILAKLKKDQLTELPEIAGSDEKIKKGLVATIRKLLAPDHRAITLKLWTAFFLSFAALYFLVSWVPKLMEDSGLRPVSLARRSC